MREIRRLVIAGFSHQQIQHQLGIPEKTYYRYLNEIFEYDRERISNYVTNEELLNQAAILEERISEMYRTMHEMVNDKTIDPSARIDAVKVAAELAFSIVKVYRLAPIRVLSDLREAIPALSRLAIPLPPTTLEELRREFEKQQQPEPPNEFELWEQEHRQQHQKEE